MKKIGLTLILLSFSLPAFAGRTVSPNNMGQQNAVANQQAHAQLGSAPAVAMGNLFISTSQALSNAAHNATNNQQQSYVTMQASTAQGVASLYGVDTSSTAVGISKILDSDPAAVRQQTGIAKFNE